MAYFNQFLLVLASVYLFETTRTEASNQKPTKQPIKFRPQIHFKLGRNAHQELEAFEYYFPGDEMARIFQETDDHHPILDKLNEFIADEKISELVRQEFRNAKKGYEYLRSFTAEEKQSILLARQLLGHMAELLERLPKDRAVRVSRLIALPDLSPLQFNHTDLLMGPRERKLSISVWDRVIS